MPQQQPHQQGAAGIAQGKAADARQGDRNASQKHPAGDGQSQREKALGLQADRPLFAPASLYRLRLPQQLPFPGHVRF